MNPWKLRSDVVAAGQALARRGLSAGTSGNVSLRHANGFFISPSGVPYESMSAGDVVQLDLRGQSVSGHLPPSSEWRLHMGIYRSRPDVDAIVHAHPRYATAVACTGRDIPAFHYMVAIAGGDSIRCAPYAPFGTEELAESAARALEGRRACLLGNHGAIAVGDDLPSALELMVEVEELAAQYSIALSIGDVSILSKEEMARLLERFKTYGVKGR
jgi:L-fuculose-phosphate aldolase